MASMNIHGGGDDGTNALIDVELYRLLVAGDVAGFNRFVSSRQVDVLELRCASDNNTVLHIAASSGKVELVNDILIQWPELMVHRNSKGDLPIHFALKTGIINIAVVDALIRWLHLQQATGNIITVRQVLERKNVEGNTALHIALQLSDEDQRIKLASELVDLYPPASYAMNNEGICPLYLTTKNEHEGVVRHMLEKLQPFKQDSLSYLTEGQSILHVAVSARRTEMLENLLSYDDEKLINVVDKEGRTALSEAAFKGFLDKVQIFHTRVVHTALISNKDKSFPIHQAVLGGHISIINILSSTRFLLDARGRNILHLATSKGDSKLVSCVLSLPDVDFLINQIDDDGNTPLHLATLGKHVEVVEVLIQNEGVNVGLLNKEGLMAYDLAKKLVSVDDADKDLVQKLYLMLERTTNDIKLFPIDEKVYLHLDNREIHRVLEMISVRRLRLKDLLSIEDGSNVLHVAACMNQPLVIVDLLVGHNCTSLMYQANKKGDLPIHSAVKVGKLGSLQALLERSNIPANRVCESPNMDGNTALHVALLNHKREIANYLYNQCPQAAYCLNKDKICPLFLAIKFWSKTENNMITNMIQGIKGNVGLQNHMKGAKSIVHVAILARNTAIVEKIIDAAPGLLDSLDSEGRSPLSYAALSGHIEGVKLLLEKCPSFEFKRDKDEEGSFPIHQAVKGGFVKVIKLFRYRHLLNNKGQNILHVAASNDGIRLSIYVLRRRKFFVPLMNIGDDDGNTPLHLATKGFHLMALYNLLKLGNFNIMDLKNKELLTSRDIFLMHKKYKDENGLSSLQIHIMEMMLNYTSNMFLRERLHNTKDRAKLMEMEAAKLLVTENKGPSFNESTNKDRANILLVVATLIITVTFAAAFSPPGGYDEKTGLPNLILCMEFTNFVCYNSVALTLAIASALILIIGMHAKGHAEYSLFWGGFYILAGLVCMMAGFSSVLMLYTVNKQSQLKLTEVVEEMENIPIIKSVFKFIALPTFIWAHSKFKGATSHFYVSLLLPLALYQSHATKRSKLL